MWRVWETGEVLIWFWGRKPEGKRPLGRPRSTGLVKIMLTLMNYFSPADRRTPRVTD